MTQTSTQYTLFDSHCHLDFPAFDHDREEILATCRQQHINNICIPATQHSHWGRVITLAAHSSDPKCHTALGLHPYFIDEHQKSHLEVLSGACCQKGHKPVAIGEIGLDFSSPTLLASKDRQEYFFHEQLNIAKQNDLPVILHSRKAHDIILKALRQYKLPRGGIIHAFSGSEQQAMQYISLGFKLGFGGIITYERANKTRQLAANLPLSCIVLETDSPDMPLSGFQGERNSPTQLNKVLATFAALRPEPVAEIGISTTNNTKVIFNII